MRILKEHFVQSKEYLPFLLVGMPYQASVNYGNHFPEQKTSAVPYIDYERFWLYLFLIIFLWRNQHTREYNIQLAWKRIYRHQAERAFLTLLHSSFYLVWDGRREKEGNVWGANQCNLKIVETILIQRVCVCTCTSLLSTMMCYPCG